LTEADSLRDQYQLRFSDNEVYRESVWQKILHRRLQAWVGDNKTVLDLGCGWGEFSRNVDAAKCFAMDMNPDAEQLIGSSAEFICQDCSQPWPLEDNCLDVVFSSNFLEHLPNKEALQATISEAQRCLKPGGKIILLGPNLRFVGGEYWDFWDHHIPLTDRSVVELLSLSGFEVDSVKPRFLPYSMSAGRNPPLLLVDIYLRLPFLWPLFGQQFLVMATVAGETP
jgi:SAM-dependent methyltransferase